LLALGAVPLAAPRAGAQVAAGTVCEYRHEVGFSPGMRLGEGGSGTFYRGQTFLGDIRCNGPFNGVVPTGPGYFTVAGSYGDMHPDTCLDSTGPGVVTFTFPTASGPRSVTSNFRFHVLGSPGKPAEGLIAMRVDGDNFVADESVSPVEGDCISAPMTRMLGIGSLRQR
jgi:hypothetical protein